MRYKTVQLIAVALLAMAPTFCGAMTGNELLADCDSTSAVSRQFCLGYTTGVVEAYDRGYRDQRLDIFTSVSGKRQESLKTLIPTHALVAVYCVPTKATYGQIRDVVVRYLRDNPDSRHLSAHSLVIQSVIKAFPCPAN